MAKGKYVKCENCGQVLKRKGAHHHKCDKLDSRRLENCASCGRPIPFRHYVEHYQKCRVRGFWKLFRPFILFFMRLIRAFNKHLKKEVYLGGPKEKKVKLSEMTGLDPHQIDIKKYQADLEEMMKKKETEELANLEKYAIEENFNLNSLDNIDAVKEGIINAPPGISCRQIIFDYLKNTGKEDDILFDFINKKLANKDYSTNEEIEENKFLKEKIEKLRVRSDYKTYYQRFYYYFVEFYEKNRDKNKCKYCDHFFVSVKNHLKKCIPFESQFNTGDNKREMIEDFLNRYYNANLWQPDKLEYYLDFYERYPARYFLKTVHEHVINRLKFKTEYDKKVQKPVEKKKWNFKDFLAEIDSENKEDNKIEDDPEVPDDFKDLVSEVDRESDEESEVEEEKNSSDEETEKEKADNDDEESKESIKIDPKELPKDTILCYESDKEEVSSKEIRETMAKFFKPVLKPLNDDEVSLDLSDDDALGKYAMDLNN